MKINVKHIAQLANLPLTQAEEEKFEKQLDETLTYIEELNKLNTDNVKPTYQVTGLENITREDVAASSLSQAKAICGAKKTHNGFFIVDAILEED